MTKITGFQRMQFTKEWIKRGKPPTREDFIKRCCDVMHIEYVEPPKIDRTMIVSESARMFPVKQTNQSEDQ